MLRHTLFLTLTALSLGVAHAGDQTPGLDQRQTNQQQRITAGVESGQLTVREAARLERGETRLERHEAAASADGVVTRRERALLHHEADVMSRRIYRQKHDAERRRRH